MHTFGEAKHAAAVYLRIWSPHAEGKHIMATCSHLHTNKDHLQGPLNWNARQRI